MLAYLLLCIFTFQIVAEDKFFVFIIPSYNNGSQLYNEKTLVEMNLESIFNQDYNNYHIIYCDDASTDNTAEKVRECCLKYNKVDKLTYVKNEYNRKAPYNVYNSVHSYCKDTDIVFILDGDDWLAPRNDLLTMLNKVYQDPDVWMTYGEFSVLSSPDGSHDVTLYTPENLQENTFRYTYFYVAPPRTFYAKLFKHLKMSNCLYNDGFFQAAGDLQNGVSLRELAGTHARYIDTVLYVYNNIISTNDGALDPRKQMFFDFFIRSKERYTPLESLFDLKSETPQFTHITFVNKGISDDELKGQYNTINSIFPIADTLACLSGFNDHLANGPLLNSYAHIIPQCSIYSCIMEDAMLKVKNKIFEYVSSSNTNYFIISETGNPTPCLERFSYEFLNLSDIFIIGSYTKAPHTLGFNQKYPYLSFLTINKLGEYYNFKKPSLIIITKEKLLYSLEKSSWMSGSYLSILAAIEYACGAECITFIPTE